MAKLAALTVRADASLTLNGDVLLILRSSHDWETAAVDSALAAIEQFVQAGSLGAYCAKAPADQSTLAMVGAPHVVQSNLQVALSAKTVDARAFQYLRHALSRLDLDPAEIDMIEVRALQATAPQRHDLLPVDDGNEDTAYPPERHDHSIRVTWDDSVEPSKSRRLEVEFGNALRRADFDRLAVPVDAWNVLLEAGAFTMPFGLPEAVENAAGATTLLTPHIAEIEVPVFRGSEVGFDCLINLLDAFSLRELPIMSVVIE